MAALQRRRWKPTLLPFSLFLVLILLSGQALVATGAAENPFESIAGIVEMNAMLQSEPSILLPPPALPDGLPPQEGEASGITWSATGEVLYNLWFFTATTALVMVVGTPLNWLVTRLTRSAPRASTVRRAEVAVQLADEKE